MADPDSADEIFTLYTAVRDQENDGIWEVAENNGMIFVKAGHVEDTLLIASEEAKNAFLYTMTQKYCHEFDDIDSWYGWKKNMENPNA